MYVTGIQPTYDHLASFHDNWFGTKVLSCINKLRLISISLNTLAACEMVYYIIINITRFLVLQLLILTNYSYHDEGALGKKSPL